MHPFKPEMGILKPGMGSVRHEMGHYRPVVGLLRLTKYFLIDVLFLIIRALLKIVGQIRVVFDIGWGTLGPLRVLYPSPPPNKNPASAPGQRSSGLCN